MSVAKDMSDTGTIRNHPGLLDLIRMIAFHSESGRLQITARSTSGAFFFHDGKLVSAHVGSLTGFPAVNAAVSITDAHFSFDPGILPPASCAITANEQIILRQFFGIETGNAEECDHRPAETGINWDLTPVPVVPLTDAEVSALSVQQPEDNAAPVLKSDEMASPISQEISAFEEPAEPGIPETGKLDEISALPAIPPLEAAALKYSEDDIADDNEHAFVRTNSANYKPWKNIPHQVLTLPPRYRRGFALAILLGVMAGGAVAVLQKVRNLRLRTEVARPSAASEAARIEPSLATSSRQQIEPSRVEPHKPTLDRQGEPPIAKQSPAALPSSQKRKTQMEQGAANSQNLTGRWKVVNVVQKTSYKSFEQLEIGFRLDINQKGKQFTAKGEKVSENGRALPAGSRIPIHATGRIDGDRVEATFFEEGTMRKTSGRFVWRIRNAGAGLSGMFVSAAAKSRGKSAATKEL